MIVKFWVVTAYVHVPFFVHNDSLDFFYKPSSIRGLQSSKESQ